MARKSFTLKKEFCYIRIMNGNSLGIEMGPGIFSDITRAFSKYIIRSDDQATQKGHPLLWAGERGICGN